MTQGELWLLNEKYNGEESEGFLADCKRLATGEPLAYLIGHIPFLGATIHLDSHPLIPRPETEYWVERAITDINSRFRGPTHKSSVTVLDLCAGSGCIGVAILYAVPLSTADFVEIENCHHSTIRKNLAENKIHETRARIYDGDLFENISGAYDYILANPPYVDKTLKRTEASVVQYEPHKALYAEKHGFALIERIIEDAPKYLTQRGVLYIEHEPEHVELLRECAQKSGFMTTSYPDQYGILRFTQLTRSEERKV